jgi:glycosyltransferase involved in cell wall biosynthesis
MDDRPGVSISGVVMAQDNAATIGDVVDELGTFCHEVVVVDGGRREATREIAARRPFVRVYERTFADFARQKNWSFDRTQGSWILVLDTDETLSSGARWQVPWLVRSPLDRFHLPRHWLVRKDGELHYLRGGPYHRARQLRLFRRSMGYRYCEQTPVHEPLEYRGRGRGLRVRLPSIYHFCLLADRATREAKVARYRSLDPRSERAHLHDVYLWEEMVERHRIPIVPLPARYRASFERRIARQGVGRDA